MAQQARRFLRQVGNPADPDGLFQWMQRYLRHIRAKGYTAQTLWGHERYLRDFIAWCDGRDVGQPSQVDRSLLEEYMTRLQNHRKRDGAPLAWLSKQSKLIPVRSFFRWLVQARHVPNNPAAELSIGRMPSRPQAETLKPNEVATLLAQPDVNTPKGIRDRAMLETLFSTGIRRMELAGLRLEDVNMESATLFVRQGKGQKDRLIPVGRGALEWIGRYMREVRTACGAPGEHTLFLTHEGEPFRLPWLCTVIGAYVRKAFPHKRGACHLLRHTMATLMLEDGADIRYIQAMLGHAQLSSTQIYTRVSIEKLQAVHARTRPGADPNEQHHAHVESQQPAASERRPDARSFHARAHAIVDGLPENANWLDLVHLASAMARVEGGTLSVQAVAPACPQQ